MYARGDTSRQSTNLTFNIKPGLHRNQTKGTFHSVASGGSAITSTLTVSVSAHMTSKGGL